MVPRHRNKVRVALHFVWTTDQRLPLVTPPLEERIHACIVARAHALRCTVLAIGGMPDHVHLLVLPPTTVSIAQIAKQVKGVSSAMARDALAGRQHFGWADGYGVFVVEPSSLERVIGYIRRQKEHHARGDLWRETEEPREPEPSPPRPQDAPAKPRGHGRS